MSGQLAGGPFGDIPNQIDSMIDDMLGRSFTRFCPVSAWQPAVNLYETAHAYVVCVDLSAMREQDFDIVAHQNSLVIRGKRPRPLPRAERSEVRVHLMEINSGEFCREVEIPCMVRQEDINAEYREGLLWITLPKRADSLERKRA